MTGVQYVKNDKGETTFLMLDWKMYGAVLQDFLENLSDIDAIKATENDELVPLAEVANGLLTDGKLSPENIELLKKVCNV